MPDGWTTNAKPKYEAKWRESDEPKLPIDDYFKSKLPDNLYRSHYDLNTLYPHYTPEEWRTHLRENDKFIQSELSVIAEAQARAALAKLSDNHDTSAIRELLSKSKMFSEAQGKKETVVFSFIPPILPRDKMPKPVIEEMYSGPVERW